MFGNLRALDTSVFEGAFVSNPYNGTNNAGTVIAGPGGLVAGTGGCAMSRFAWADPLTGATLNARADGQLLGFVQPQRGGWTRQYYDSTLQAWVIRQGLMLTMFGNGDFWAKFPGGAYPGDVVYADTIDGHAVSGETDGAIATPWKVASFAPANGLAQISTSIFFGA